MSDPESLLPPNSTSLERSIEAVIATRLQNILIPLRDLFNPNLIDDLLLPWLAWSVNSLEWRSDLDSSRKRNAIAISVQVHNTLGTKSALRRGLDAIGLTNVNIIELPVVLYDGSYNFDGSINYSEGPFLFDIQLTDESQILSIPDIKRAIATFSNARSHLRYLYISQLYYNGAISFDGAENFDGGFIIG